MFVVIFGPINCLCNRNCVCTSIELNNNNNKKKSMLRWMMKMQTFQNGYFQMVRKLFSYLWLVIVSVYSCGDLMLTQNISSMTLFGGQINGIKISHCLFSWCSSCFYLVWNRRFAFHWNKHSQFTYFCGYHFWLWKKMNNIGRRKWLHFKIRSEIHSHWAQYICPITCIKHKYHTYAFVHCVLAKIGTFLPVL